MNNRYQIRLAKFHELSLLNDIEQSASTIFQNTKYALETNQECLSLELCQQQQSKNLIWVAVDEQKQLVGFAVILIVDNLAHLHELSVTPQHGRKGIGSKLVKEIINWAKQANFKAITLSTFSDIPWNAPFYKKLGFDKIKEEEIGQELKIIRLKEAELGLPIEDRILMILKI